MRSSMLPTSLVLFLLLCFAGCGGGDSPEVANADGDGSTESTATDGASDPAQMYGGSETRTEGGSGSGSDGASDPAEMYGGSETRTEGGSGPGGDGASDPAEMYGGSETRTEGGSGSGGDGASDPAEMYAGSETRGEHDEEESGDEEAYAEMYEGGEDRGEHDEEDADDEEAYAEMYEGEEDRGEHDEEDAGDDVAAQMYAPREDRGEHDEGSSDEEDSAEMYGGGENRGGSGESGPMRGGDGGGPRKSAQPKTFADMANQAFGQGRETEAFQFLFAHAVTADDQSAGTLLAKMGWIAPLKRPGLGVRWGVGIEFNNKGYNGNDLYPIGTTQQIQNRNQTGYGQGRRDDGGGGFGGPGDMGKMQGGSGGNTQGGGGSDAQLERFTGEMGQKVVAGLGERIERGDFGLVLKEASSGAAPKQGQGMVAGGQMGPYGSGPEAYGEEDPGGFDNAGPPRGMGGPGGRQPTATQLVTGVTLLGVAPAKDLVKMAQENGIDALCVFKVTVSSIPRKNLVSNKVEIQLYNLANGKKTYESDELANLFVQAERAKENSRGGDPVDKEIEKLFKEIDTDWRLASLPALQPDHVLVRIGDLLKESHQNPLPVLAEIRMYHTRGLLQDNHLLLAYQRTTNDQSGSMLATGTEEERKQVIQPWLPTGR